MNLQKLKLYFIRRPYSCYNPPQECQYGIITEIKQYEKNRRHQYQQTDNDHTCLYTNRTYLMDFDCYWGERKKTVQKSTTEFD